MSLFSDSVVGVAALVATTYGLGKWADEVLNPKLREQYSAYLLNLELTKDRTVAFHSVLRNMLNAVFGYSIISRRAFAGSAAMTAVGSAIVLSLAIFTMQSRSPEAEVLKSLTTVIDWLLATGTLFASSLLVDYLSLLKSLAIINSSGFEERPVRFYLADLAISVLLSVGWVLLLGVTLIQTGAFSSDQRTFVHGMEPMVFCILSFFTALLPTLFTLGFCAATVAARLAMASGRPIRFLVSRILDVERKPFSSSIAIVWIMLVPLYIGYHIAA